MNFVLSATLFSVLQVDMFLQPVIKKKPGYLEHYQQDDKPNLLSQVVS